MVSEQVNYKELAAQKILIEWYDQANWWCGNQSTDVSHAAFEIKEGKTQVDLSDLWREEVSS